MQKHDQYKRHIHTLNDITTYFRESSLVLKTSEIVNPTATTTLDLFDSLLQHYTGKKCVHTDKTLYTIQIYKQTRSFLEKIGINLSLREFLQIESKRLIYILGEIVNFAIFRDCKMGVYLKADDMRNDIVKSRNEIENRNFEIEKEIKKYRNVLRSSDFFIQGVEIEYKKVEDEIEKLRNIENMIEKNEKLEMNKKWELENLVRNMESKRRNIYDLKNQIVIDPQRLIAEIEKIEGNINNLKKDILFLEEEDRKNNIKISKIKNFISSLIRVHSVCNLLLKLRTDFDKTTENIKKLNCDMKNGKTTEAAQKLKINHLLKQIEQLEKNEIIEENKYSKNLEDYEIQKSKFKCDILKYEEDHRRKENGIIEVIDEFNHINTDIQNRKEEHQNAIINLKTSILDLKNKVSSSFIETYQKFRIN